MIENLVWVAWIAPLLLALFAFFSRALDIKGTVAGLAIAYVILWKQDAHWLLLLFAFFMVATLATKLKADYKKRYGLYQKIRSTENVLSNGGVAALMALMNSPYGFLGALSAAFADTLSSELGVLAKKKPRLITTLQPVEAGTDGAISVFGTACGVLGAVAAGVIGLTIIPDFKVMALIVASGIVGCVADSFIGATLERKGPFKNWTTNFFATTFGALFALIVGPLL